MKKNTFRKFISTGLIASMAISLAACGSTTATSSGSSAASDSTVSAAAESSGNAEEAATTTASTSATIDVNNITNRVDPVSDQYANSATKKHEKIVVCSNGDPGNLLPQDTQTSGKEILDNFFEKLYVIDGFGGDLLPCIAESLPEASGTDDDGLYTYDIKIRDNISDSDGNKMTASDIAYSYNWLVSNSTPQNMGKYHSAEAVDDYTVRFHCDELNGVSDFGNLFAQQWIFTEAAQKAHDFATDPVGTGPYVVKSYTEGSEVILEARDDYWAEGQDYQLARNRANVQTIDYVIMGDASQQANALRTGEIDYSNAISETDIPDFINDGEYAANYVVYPYQENLTYYLLPNCDSSSQCSDENLRKAIMYAADGASCALASGNSTAEVVYDLYNSKFPEYRDSWKDEDTFYTGSASDNLAKAAEYLAASNYDGSEITLCTNDAPPACKNVAEVVVNILNGIGINCKLNVLSASISSTTMSDPTSWDLSIGMMAADDYGVVDVARLMSKDSYGGDQETVNFIKDDKLQDLITLVNTADGHTDENTQALHDYLIENAYGRGLFNTTTFNIATNKIKELSMSYKFLIIPGGCVYEDNEF